jgi:hypothetical protein
MKKILQILPLLLVLNTHTQEQEFKFTLSSDSYKNSIIVDNASESNLPNFAYTYFEDFEDNILNGTDQVQIIRQYGSINSNQYLINTRSSPSSNLLFDINNEITENGGIEIEFDLITYSADTFPSAFEIKIPNENLALFGLRWVKSNHGAWLGDNYIPNNLGFSGNIYVSNHLKFVFDNSTKSGQFIVNGELKMTGNVAFVESNNKIRVAFGSLVDNYPGDNGFYGSYDNISIKVY